MPQLIHWSDEARADVRAINREIAQQIFKCVYRFQLTGAGDVVRLHGFDPPRFRLRVGDWRVVFYKRGDGIEIARVRNRREAYR